MKKTLILLASAASLLVATNSVHAATGFLKIHMFAAGDGRGDCFIIELPDNTKMVVDIPDTWTTPLINKLNALGFGGGIKYLVGTHEHIDHIGGMNNFLNTGFTINNTQVYYPKGAINANAGPYDNLVTAAGNRGLAVTKLKAGDYIINTTHDGKAFKVRCLSPENYKIDGGADDWGSENEASLVLKITYGSKSILMQADGYGSTELSILAGPFAGEINACQVLKVGHHGTSANGAISCREAYLDAAGVNKALITDGDRGIDATIKQRLQDRNISYWSTGVGDGYCWLSTDGTSNWQESEPPLWPVTTPPSITTQPASQTVVQGSSATFSVVATGTAPLTYQWRFNGANISGATASSYTRSNAQPSHQGNYSVVVANAAGSVTSANASLTVRVLVTLDNVDAGFSVTSTNWSTGTTATDKYGTNYRFRGTASVSDAATWVGTLGNAGSYAVSAWWSQGVNRSTTAPYIVYHSTGSTTVNKNQQANGGTWQSLGSFALNAGTNTVKLSCWTTTGFVVIADAVKWAQ